jgi:hypothetical protein
MYGHCQWRGKIIWNIKSHENAIPSQSLIMVTAYVSIWVVLQILIDILLPCGLYTSTCRVMPMGEYVSHAILIYY